MAPGRGPSGGIPVAGLGGISVPDGGDREAALMPDEIDTYRSANLLIQQHGEDAPVFAAQQADKCPEAGDSDGCAVWKRVLKAVEELLDRRPIWREPAR